VGGFPRWLTNSQNKTADLNAFMADYPQAAGYITENRHDNPGEPAFQIDENGIVVVTLRWESGYPDPTRPELAKWLDNNKLTKYRGIYRRYLFPRIAGNAAPLHPLMAWWALLFGLSMLARYQPAEWVAHIDVDSSPYAVGLETLLESALTAVPYLIMTALGELT
jgi:hypothetical protein